MRVLFLAGLAGGLEMIKTPYYLIDKTKLLHNMQKIAYVREHSGAKAPEHTSVDLGVGYGLNGLAWNSLKTLN